MFVNCGNPDCHHNAEVDVSGLPDNVTFGELQRRMLCTVCDHRGADVGPSWLLKLFPESLGWKGEFRLRDKIGEVTEIRGDGRITVRFQNGWLLRGRDAEGFEKFEPGLKAKGK